ncbi:hypothetical protein HY413_00365 [Candidatus Kaiserbacteria bacterium]|nr:hypothetical protein [Candidatus Kaiserbacteria bacterium]
MADVPESSGGTAFPLAVLGVLAALAFFVPTVGEFVFQWVPAALSVVSGVEMSGDVRDIPKSPPEKEIIVAMHAVPNGSLLAQVSSAFGVSEDVSDLPAPAQEVSMWWNSLIPLSIFISLLFIVGIVYSVTRIVRIREIERLAWMVEEHPVAANVPSKAQLRWNKILEHANTENPNDWRQAIIEADIMLDELLTVQGYHGDTVGDKMKQVEKSDFNTIDLAWDAHKVRNRIAHEGSGHDLNAREVRRVIALYEQVLHEFHFI